MKRYNKLSYRIAKSFINQKKASKLRKVTNIISDIMELDELLDNIYRNFNDKNIEVILASLPVIKTSVMEISRTFGGSVSDVNALRKIAMAVDDLIEEINKGKQNDRMKQYIHKYKNNFKKIRFKVKRLI